MREGVDNTMRSRTVHKAVLVASWILLCLTLSLLTAWASLQERIVFCVLPELGASLGCLLKVGSLVKRVPKEKVIRTAQMVYAVLLILGLVAAGLFIVSAWVMKSPTAVSSVLKAAIVLNRTICAARVPVALLAVLMSLIWSALCAHWVGSAPNVDRVSFDKKPTVFESLVLVFGALFMMVQPLELWTTTEELVFSWMRVVFALLWGIILWPIMGMSCLGSNATERQRVLGHDLGLLTTGSICAGTYVVLAESAYDSANLVSWLSLGLLVIAGCAACVFAWRAGGKREDNASVAVEVTPQLPSDLMGLSMREYEALKLAASGVASKDIGAELGIAASTAREYVRRARAKFLEQGLFEQDVLLQKSAEQPGDECDTSCATANPYALFMTVLVVIALSPFGVRIPTDGEFVAALLVGFAVGGLVLLPLRHQTGLAMRFENAIPQWLCIVPPLEVVILRMVSWRTLDTWLVTSVSAASVIMGFTSFLVWGRLGKLSTVMKKQEPLVHLWLFVLSCCCALMWFPNENGVASILLMVCCVVLTCGLLAALFLVARWSLVYVLACLACFVVLAIIGGLKWQSGLLCCVLAFVPWVIEGMKSEHEGGQGIETNNKPLMLLASAEAFPVACMLGALLTIVISLGVLSADELPLLIVACALLTLATLVITVWFVFALNTSLHVARSAGYTKGDNERLLRAWLSVRGVNELNADVALGLVRGESVSAMAERLGYSKSAIRRARQTCYRLLGVHSRVSLIKLLMTFIESNGGS